MRYIFGPVHSRRLGVSLGIDLVPYKTCSLDCVYCECGDTTHLTLERREWVPTDAVLEELDAVLSKSPEIDVVTFSGSGEPTLHSGIGRIIRFLKDKYPAYRVVVLTNSTLLWQENVIRDIQPADIVIPSLDAVSEDVFKRILRPDDGLSAEMVIEGLVRFRKDYHGRLVLEIFLVPGINDTDMELSLIRNAALRIRPDLVYLNHLDRPGAESWVGDVPDAELERIADYLHPLPVEIVGRIVKKVTTDDSDAVDSVRRLIEKKDMSIDGIVTETGLRYSEVRRILGGLIKSSVVLYEECDHAIIYRINPGKK